MGSDKSLLTYHAKPQRHHLYDMLRPICDKVFISCNKEQVNTIGHDLPFIQDDESYGDIGPIKALLTACNTFPDMNMLLIGCDYPFLTATELIQFAASCTSKPAAFFNESAGKYEPLLAWYPSVIFNQLKKYATSGGSSLQFLLSALDALQYRPGNKSSMISVDTYEAYENTRQQLKQ